MIEIYQAMARYNRWMNEKLFAVCEPLSDEERKRDRGAPFRSIHGTFNHLLLADRLWMGRFTDQLLIDPGSLKSLGDEIYADFAQLRVERDYTDSTIEAFVETLTLEKIMVPFRYVPYTLPEPRTYPFYICLSHLFNHQTHHRGQLTTLLEQMGVDFGVTDLAAMPGVLL